MLQNKWAALLLSAFWGFLATGCHTSSCLKQFPSATVLRWGMVDSAGVLRGYQISQTGTLDSIIRTTPTQDPAVVRSLGIIPADTICALLLHTRQLFLRNRPLFVRIAPLSAYVELVSSAETTGRPTRLFALWDPRFENAGNRAFRMLYQRLMRVRSLAR